MSSQASSQDLASVIAAAHPRPFRKWILIFFVIAIATAGGVYFYLNRGGETAEFEYMTRPVARGEIAIRITATGNLAPTNEVTVGSELSGTIEEVNVETNDEVKKGQQVAKLDPTKVLQTTERSRASFESAKARVRQVEATLAEAKANDTRLRELHRLSNGKTPSQAELDASIAAVERAEADLSAAKATVSQAEAEVKANESDLEKTVIRSPVDGIVLSRTVEPGQTVAASFTAPTLFEIAEDLRKMELAVAVAEADIGRVSVGQKVVFSVDAWPKRTYEATVKKVTYGSTVTNNVVTYSTELEVDNSDLSLRPGMTATAEISIEHKKDILTIPNAALRFDPSALEVLTQKQDNTTIVQQIGPRRMRRRNNDAADMDLNQPSVWALREGKPVEIKIETGLTDGFQTEVTSSELKEGDQLIISAKPTAKS